MDEPPSLDLPATPPSTRDRLARENEILRALMDATHDVRDTLELEAVLKRTVQHARELTGARYGALAVYDPDGKIVHFLTSGIDEETAARIDHPPEGRGLLAVVIDHGEPLRLDDIAGHPKSVGFPPGHPPMRSLLAVPVISQAPFRGNLYLSDRIGPAGEKQPFSVLDEETLTVLAHVAGRAVNIAYLQQLRRKMAVAEEREWLARELHDNVAQVLGYVNTKAAAVTAYLDGRDLDQARAQLEQLAQAARAVYADVRESILGLRVDQRGEQSLSEVLSEYATQWQDQSGVRAEIEIEPELALSPDTELQLMRIAQEALSNVRKHAEAKQARLSLRREDGALTLTVEDDGVGYDPSALSPSGVPRFGLATMRERAEAIGGQLRIETSPGSGTRLTVDVADTRRPFGSGWDLERPTNWVAWLTMARGEDTEGNEEG